MQDGSHLKGLTGHEARERLLRHGPNELPASKPRSAWRIALEVVREPMFLLLLGCGSIYVALGDYREGASLMVAIFIIIGITYFQHKRSERALDALRDLSSPRALVVRDGRRTRIAGRDVVPGDLVVLAEGDRVPADGVVLASEGMLVDVSMLTGESVPVHVTAQEEGSDDEGHRVYGSTLVTQGHGIACISATGSDTLNGSIGRALVVGADKGTRLQVEMKGLIRKLGLIGTGICVVVVASYYFTRGAFLDALLVGLSTAIAVLPEEFPMVLTVFLAIGAWRLSRDRVLTRRPSAIETLGSATVLCTDKTGTLTLNRMRLVVATDMFGNESSVLDRSAREMLGHVLTHAYHATPPAPFDPMEVAIREVFLTSEDRPKDTRLVREYPFSRGAMMTTRVHASDERSTLIASAKGAPEVILSVCDFSAEQREQVRRAVGSLAERGLRVIAVATAELHDGSLPEQQSGFHFTFSGLLGLEDPVRPEVPEAVQQCRSAGVRVIMMTGDHPTTARAIGRRIGLEQDAKVIEGPLLERMDDEALRLAMTRTSIFARMVPEQKLRIVAALRANNEVVAMTGDGVNDAPALSAADIGIAMGSKGTDVAREASSLVLMDDDFSSIVSAIRLGRRIYDNLRKSMDFILAVHVPIIGLALLPAFIPSLPVLLMPMHIALLEIIIDPVCALVFEVQSEEKGLMQRPPRQVNASFFGRQAIRSSAMKGLLALITVLVIYFLSINEGHTEQEVRSIAFGALLLVNGGLVITNLSRTSSAINTLARMSWSMRFVSMSPALLFVLILLVPWAQNALEFQYAGWRHYLPAFLGASGFVSVMEIARWSRRK